MHDKNETIGNFQNDQHRINDTNRQISTIRTKNEFSKQKLDFGSVSRTDSNLKTYWLTKLENGDRTSVDVWKLWYAVFYFILLVDW